jgi:hypothetical protein
MEWYNRIEKAKPLKKVDGMNQEQVTFEKVAWAAFLVRISEKDHYWRLYCNTELRRALVYNPIGVSREDVRYDLIQGFLNKWRSRFPNSNESANAILATLQRISPFLQATDGFDIETVDLDQTVHVGDRQLSIFQAIAEIFDAVVNCYGFRTTAGAKIMGIINPRLFVMWDDNIALHYLSKDVPSVFSGLGYSTFLRKMQKQAQQCIKDFEKRHGAGEPASYLSERLGLNPPLPLAKYLDEYNWITITRGLQVPPKWHPCDNKMVTGQQSTV